MHCFSPIHLYSIPYLFCGSISEGTDERLESLNLSVFDLNDPYKFRLVLTQERFPKAVEIPKFLLV